jgi:predicted lipase
MSRTYLSRSIQVKAFINNTEDIQGFVGYSPSHNAVIAAFRGTVDVKNWIANLDGSQVGYSKCSGCAVHKGFYNGYSEVSATVKAQVQFVLSKYRTAAIYVTGHSLGGALATLAALDIKGTFGRLDVFYSYGEPRVGNAAFASYFANQVPVFRVIHYADIVPHVPPLNMAYTHGGNQIWYTEDMQKYQVCAAEDPNCADSLPTYEFSTNDHSLSLYLKMPVSLIQMFGLRRGANF